MTPEKKLVYKVFALLNTHVSCSLRKSFDIGYVSAVKDQLTVDLKRDVLERSMKGAPSTNADNILATLSMVYQSSIDKEQAGDASEELDDGDLAEAVSDSRRSDSTEKSTCTNKLEKIKKKKMSTMIGNDLWKAGKEEFSKKNVIEIRREAERRRIKKANVRDCILHNIRDQKESGKSIVMPDDMDYMMSWQVYFRNHANNLRLKMIKE